MRWLRQPTSSVSSSDHDANDQRGRVTKPSEHPLTLRGTWPALHGDAKKEKLAYRDVGHRELGLVPSCFLDGMQRRKSLNRQSLYDAVSADRSRKGRSSSYSCHWSIGMRLAFWRELGDFFLTCNKITIRSILESRVSSSNHEHLAAFLNSHHHPLHATNVGGGWEGRSRLDEIVSKENQKGIALEKRFLSHAAVEGKRTSEEPPDAKVNPKIQARVTITATPLCFPRPIRQRGKCSRRK
jgi:hypothetical protein